MAGEYYRAKQRTGGVGAMLKPIIDYFNNQLEEEEKKQQVVNLLNAYKQSQQKIKDIGSTTEEPSTWETEESVLNRGARKPVKTVGDETRPPDIEIDNGIETEMLGDLIPPEERTKRGQQEADDFSVNQLLDPENLDPDLTKVNTLGTMLNRQVDRMRPPEIEKEEKIIQEGKPDKKIDEYVNANGKKILVFQKTNGEVYEKELGNVRKSGGTGKKKDEYKDVGKQRGNVNTVIKNIENIKKSSWDEKTQTYQVTGFDDEGKPTTVPMTKEQFRSLIEKKKQDAVDDITEIIGEDGRDLQGAIDAIKKKFGDDLKKIPYSKIQKAINSFIKANPDYAADKVNLIAYFKLFKF